MGSTLIHWSLISLFAPQAVVCDPSSSQFASHVCLCLPSTASSVPGSIPSPPGRGGLPTSHCSHIGTGRALRVVGGSNLGLGPQQRGPGLPKNRGKWLSPSAQPSLDLVKVLCPLLGLPRQEKHGPARACSGEASGRSRLRSTPESREGRPGSLALHRGTWQKGMSGNRRLQVGYQEKLCSLGQAAQALSWEVSSPNWTQP